MMLGNDVNATRIIINSSRLLIIIKKNALLLHASLLRLFTY